MKTSRCQPRGKPHLLIVWMIINQDGPSWFGLNIPNKLCMVEANSAELCLKAKSALCETPHIFCGCSLLVAIYILGTDMFTFIKLA